LDHKIKIVYPDSERSEIERNIEFFDRLRAFADFQIFTGRPVDNAEFVARIHDADGILLGWGMPGDVMRQAKNLQVVSFAGIGVAQFVDLAQARERGIGVCNCPGYSNNTVAEHALALLLGVARHLARLDSSLRKGEWNQSIDGFELSGTTIGLIGFGGIGQTFARLCKALGMEVLVWTRNMSDQRSAKYGVTFAPLATLYERCDVISLHAAYNAETANLIDHDAFAQMKTGALLINTARAELVDEAALIDALNSGKLGGAGLDVFWHEPLPADHPLTSMDNVIISPHVGFNTQQAVNRLFDIATNNLVQYFQGNPINQVTE